MVDAIAPAADALTNAAAQQSNLGEALEAAAHAARVGAESTRSLIASRGRASYVGEVARGVLGPGAVSVALFFASAVVTNGGQGPDQAHLGRMEPREATALDCGLRPVVAVTELVKGEIGRVTLASVVEAFGGGPAWPDRAVLSDLRGDVSVPRPWPLTGMAAINWRWAAVLCRSSQMPAETQPGLSSAGSYASHLHPSRVEYRTLLISS